MRPGSYEWLLEFEDLTEGLEDEDIIERIMLTITILAHHEGLQLV